MKYDFVTNVERSGGTMTLSEKDGGATGVGAGVGEMMAPVSNYHAIALFEYIPTDEFYKKYL